MQWILITLTLFGFSNLGQAEENTGEVSQEVAPTKVAPANGYISDDLFIYMHAGPGTNYRILGTVNAGSAIKITGNAQNNYSEIIDDKNRTTWVESKYTSTKPSLRTSLISLQEELNKSKNFLNQSDGEVNELKSQLDATTAQNKELMTELSDTKKLLSSTQSQVKDQDTNIKKQWFFNGAIVLALGLLLGLLLPKFFSRKRGGMDNWG